MCAAETPRRPNILRLARVSDPATLDPALALTTEDGTLLLLLHQPLLDTRQGTNFFGRGAANWNLSPDARTFTAQLRPEVRFSNGRPVVAADYAYAIQRAADPRTGSWQQGYLSNVRGFADFTEGRTNRLAGVRVEGDHTLLVELEKPDAIFPQMFGGLSIALPAEEVARAGSKFGVHPIGAGPYRLADWKRGVRIVFEPNPYCAESGPRRFDRIEIMIGGDETTHLMMFERGELDIANIVGNGVPLSDLSRLTRDPHWGPLIEVLPGLNTGFITLNNEAPPLDNRQVRRALNYAVDKPRRMLTAMRQFAAAGGILPPTMPGYDPTVKGYPYDPDQARRLLAATGLSLPLRMMLWHPNDQLSRMVCEGVQSDLHAVGVELELKAAAFAQMLEVIGTRGRTHMGFAVYNPGPDPRDIIATMFEGHALRDNEPFNTAFYNNTEVNRLIDVAASTVEPTRRIGLYQEAERLIVEDAPWIFLGYRNLFALRQPWLKGPFLEPSGSYRLDRAWMEQ